VLKLSAAGKTACEIGLILSVTERTVNFHVHSAIQKLGVCNKIAAVIAAAKAGAI
jgi:LuxR family transcriptional regulator